MDRRNMTDEKEIQWWCEQAARGNREAGSKLLGHFHRPIFGYLRRLSGNDTDADDLTQQTFSKVWQSLGSFRGAASLNTWIHRIAYCTYIDWVRQRRPGEEQPEGWWESLPATGMSPFESVAEADWARQLYALVQHLEPESRRAAIHLHYYQNLSLPETAEVLGLPLSTLKYQLRAALDELRCRLGERERTLSSSDN
jgi:RNA polymerase sigma-70 factor (ECF subfamily)